MKALSKIVVIILALLFPINDAFSKVTLRIKTQEQFDSMQQSIENYIKSGKYNITIKIYPGLYLAKEQHINLNNISSNKVSLRLIGRNSTIIPQGKTYYNGECYNGVFNPDYSWVTESGDAFIWSETQFADDLVEVLDKAKKICRLKSKSNYPPNTDVSNAYILIPHWFRSSIYKIDKIEGNYITFTADDLGDGYEHGYNINDDSNYGQSPIRYKVCNLRENSFGIIDGRVFLPEGTSVVREGNTNCFISFHDCALNTIEIKGIRFMGNASVSSLPTLYFNSCEARRIIIRNCSFSGIHCDVMRFEDVNNVEITNNSFSDCYRRGIYSDNDCDNVIIKGNTFNRMGIQMQNSFCIACRGSKYYVGENELCDFGYGGIGVGVGYRQKKSNLCCGIVENNRLYFSDYYYNNIPNYCIMDGGAIYAWTKNDRTVIRYNYINHYTGMSANRGIYCDDGAFNIEVYGNIVLNTTNSNSIESRRVPIVEKTKTPDSGIERANTNVVIHDNIVDGKILFVGHEDTDNGCVKGKNYIIQSESKKLPKNTYKNLNALEEDEAIQVSSQNDDHINLPESSYRIVSRSNNWKELKRYIKRK